MKCKHCNGTGKVRGYFYEKTDVNKWEKVWGDSPCQECNGTGKLKQTNEEWFCQLSTEEKAEFLCNVGFENETIVRKFKSEWVEWLKQLHNREEQSK